MTTGSQIVFDDDFPLPSSLAMIMLDRFHGAPANIVMGLQVTRISEHTAAAKLASNESIMGMRNAPHGGTLASASDSLGALQAVSTIAQHMYGNSSSEALQNAVTSVRTIEHTMSFIKAIDLQSEYVVVAESRGYSRKFVIVDTEIQANSETVALGRARFYYRNV